MAGLTQEELADRSGVSDRQIRRLEAGTHLAPRRSTVRMLSASLGLSEYQGLGLMKLAYGEVDPWRERTAEPNQLASDGGSHQQPPINRSRVVPAPLTSLVGRGDVIERIRMRLLGRDARLTTITGPPGIGKTRVALETARLLDGDLPGGAHLVWLAPLREASLMPAQIAATIACGTDQSGSSVADLCRMLGDQAQLLVLDNLEHVIDAAPLIPELLRQCPELRILVTSRVRLNVSGENLEPLSPLAVPCVHARSNSEPILRTESEELFLQRARAVDPLFETTGSADRRIADVCKRVDGVPLAIELAAAQLALRAFDESESGNVQLLPLLIDGPVDRPERLRTMMNSLEWSYSLLSDDEQLLLRHLSVFPGGADLAAIRAVCPERFRDSDISPLLDRLVEQNLVIRQPTSCERDRFGLLELIREYANQMLQTEGESEAARERMMNWYVALAEQYERQHWLPNGTPLPVWVADDLPNLWQVLRWLEEGGVGAGLLRLTGSLHGIWTSGGYLREGQRWLERALEIGQHGPPKDRSRCRVSLGHISFYLGNLDRAGNDFAIALQEASEAGDPAQLAWVETALGALEISRGNYCVGKTLSEQALSAAASAATHEREMVEAIARWVPGVLGRAEHGLGNFEQADTWFRSGVEQMEAHGQFRGVARVLEAWGTLAIDQGRAGVALDRFRRSTALAHMSGDDAWVAVCLPMAACALGRLEFRREAVQLLGASDAWSRESGQISRFSSMNARVEEDARQLLRASMPPEEFQAAWSTGGGFSMDEAVAFLNSVAMA